MEYNELLQKIYKNLLQNISYEKFLEEQDDIIQKFDIDGKIYYFIVDNFQEHQVCSLLDDEANVIITNLTCVTFYSDVKWFKLSKLDVEKVWTANFYDINKDKLVSEEWFNYVEEGLVKVDFNPESDFISFFHVRTNDGRNNMLLGDGTYYLPEWIETDFIFFNNGFINYHDVETNTDKLLSYDLQLLSPIGFDNVTGSFFNEYQSLVKLNNKWNVFNCVTKDYLFKNWYDGIDTDPLFDLYKNGNKYWRVIVNDKCNYMDDNENIIFPEWYDSCHLYHEHYGFVYNKNQGYMFIDNKGTHLLDKFYKGLIHVENFEKDIINIHYIYCNDINIVDELGIYINRKFDVKEDGTFHTYDHINKLQIDKLEKIIQDNPDEIKHIIQRYQIHHENGENKLIHIE